MRRKKELVRKRQEELELKLELELDIGTYEAKENTRELLRIHRKNMKESKE